MLGIDRRVLQTTWTVFLFLFALAAIYEIRTTLVLFALALFLANLLSPVVERVHWLIPPSGSRGPAAAVVYVVLIGILVALAIPIGSKIAEEAASLANRLPTEIQQDPLSQVHLPAWLEPQRPRLAQIARDRIEQIGLDVVPMLSNASEHILSGVGSVLKLILIPILSFYILKDGLNIRRALASSLEEEPRKLVDGILVDLHLLLARYIRALLLLGVATFVLYLAFLSAVGVPYALLLAGVSAALEIIPVVGPLAGASVILLVAALNGYPHLLWVFLFLCFYRIFQDYVLNPFLMSAGVEVHPVLVLLGVLVGEQLGGVPGMFFSVPLIAALRVILARVRKHHHESGLGDV
jgi:predicted PurR-regulated permease PerM